MIAGLYKPPYFCQLNYEAKTVKSKQFFVGPSMPLKGFTKIGNRKTP